MRAVGSALVPLPKWELGVAMEKGVQLERTEPEPATARHPGRGWTLRLWGGRPITQKRRSAAYTRKTARAVSDRAQSATNWNPMLDPTEFNSLLALILAVALLAALARQTAALLDAVRNCLHAARRLLDVVASALPRLEVRLVKRTNAGQATTRGRKQ